MKYKFVVFLAILAFLGGISTAMADAQHPASITAVEDVQSPPPRPSSAAVDDVLYFSDFEGTAGGLTGSLDWEWGTYAWDGTGCYNASNVPPPAAYSGTDMWGTVLNTCYNDLANNTGYNTCINGNPADDSILSLTIDLTGAVGEAELSWWEWNDLFMDFDWGEVYANGEVVFQHCGGGYVAPTAWVQQVVDLTPYIGGPVTIEFHMMASSVVNYAGWYIDDVMVTGQVLLLEAEKDAPLIARNGDVISYTITLSASELIDGLYIVDPLPAGVEYSGNLTWTLGTAWYDDIGNAVHWEYTSTAPLATPAVPVPLLPPDPDAALDLAANEPAREACTPAVLDSIETYAYPDAVLWDNGPLVTLPGDCSGMDASRLQSGLGMSLYGFGDQYSVGNRMADDFVVAYPAGWQIDQITFFAYQTNAPVTSTITGVYYQIWDGPPDDPASNVIFGDLATNRLIGTTFTGIQRDSETSSCANIRYIFANVASAGVMLPPGTYWLDWMTDGTLTSGPWAPPITILGQTVTGDAMQFTTSTGTWNPANDTGSGTQQGMPFIIEGGFAAPPQVTFDVTVTGHCGDLIINTGTAGLDALTVPFTATTLVDGDAAIDVAPSSLEASICPDTTTVDTLQICNVGDCPLWWNLHEMPTTLKVVSIPPSDGNFPRGESAPSAGLAPIEPASDGVPTTPLVPTDLQILGAGVYATEAVNGFQTLFDPDMPEVLLNLGAFTPGGFPGAGEYVNGYIYIADTINTLYQLDPATGAVLSSYPITAPPNSETYSGFALDPTSGVLYGSSTNIGTSSLLQVDPTTGVATLIGPITGSGCNIAIAIDGTGQMYGYDICTDDFWAIDKNSGAGTLIGSIGFDANFGQGMGWDQATNQMYMAAFNNSTFQPELRIVDLTTGNTAMVGGPLGSISPTGLCQLPWLGMRAYSDIPWLSTDLITGTVPGGSCQDVEVTFDATGLAPGDYMAELLIFSNDLAAPQVSIPVSMTVPEAVYGAAMSWSPAMPAVGETIDFTASVGGGTSPFTYLWDFGDGYGDVGMSASHAYLLGGTYDVELTVENVCGTSTVTETLTLYYQIYMPVMVRTH